MSNSEGFGIYKPDAIKLLKTTITILNEFQINHFLISGTLLGFVRHNDFIPWDDDIDLIVDESIIDKLSDISKKYPNINIFRKSNHKYDSIKFCFSDGLEIPTNDSVIEWRKNSITQSNKYCWPFIDLFVYESGPGLHHCNREFKDEIIGNVKLKVINPNSGHCQESFRLFPESEISFFHNEWRKSEFFPPRQVSLLGVNCNIPNNPNYFLSINYGPNYMTEIKKPQINHKNEEIL